MKRVLTNISIGVLLVLSFVLIFNQPLRDFIIGSKSNEYIITKFTPAEIEENKKVETTFDFSQVESISTDKVLAAQWDAQHLPVIGGIAIPELQLNLPIFKGLANEVLYYGAGTMKPDQEMGQGNYTLASHHMFGVWNASAMLFSPLANAKNGQKIYITDKQKIYIYEIDSVEIVNPDRIEVVNDTIGRTEITLVTCTDINATQRIIVKGILKESVLYSIADPTVKDYFNQKYNQLNQ